MKKSVLIVWVLLFAAANVYASAPQTDAEREAHRKEMKVIKEAQRAARQNKVKEAPKRSEPGFWSKVAERSCLSRVGAGPNFLERLNPMPFFKSQDDQYRARKAASTNQ